MKKIMTVTVLSLLVLGCVFSGMDVKNIKTVQPYLKEYGQNDYVGVITLKPGEFYALTEQEIFDFVRKNIVGNKTGWTSFTICCSDGTGIQFPGCSSSYGQYGKLDNCYGTVEPVIGWFTTKGTTFGYISDDGRITSWGYVYNRNTKTFHYPWCSYVPKISDKNLVVKHSVSSGDKTCKICMANTTS